MGMIPAALKPTIYIRSSSKKEEKIHQIISTNALLTHQGRKKIVMKGKICLIYGVKICTGDVCL